MYQGRSAGHYFLRYLMRPRPQKYQSWWQISHFLPLLLFTTKLINEATVYPILISFSAPSVRVCATIWIWGIWICSTRLCLHYLWLGPCICVYIFLLQVKRNDNVVFSSQSDASNPTNKAFHCYLSCFSDVEKIVQSAAASHLHYWDDDFSCKKMFTYLFLSRHSKYRHGSDMWIMCIKS